MSANLKCYRCGLVNPAASDACRRCQAPFQQIAIPQPMPAQPPQGMYQPPSVQQDVNPYQAQQGSKKQPMSVVHMGCLGCAIIFMVMLVVANVKSVKPSPVTQTKTSTVDINARVSFTETQFVITNNNNFDWTKVRFEVNDPGLMSSGYKLYVDVIKANNVYTIGALQFANDKGERLNPFTIKPQSISISCDTPNGMGFYQGGWQ